MKWLTGALLSLTLSVGCALEAVYEQLGVELVDDDWGVFGIQEALLAAQAGALFVLGLATVKLVAVWQRGISSESVKPPMQIDPRGFTIAELALLHKVDSQFLAQLTVVNKGYVRPISIYDLKLPENEPDRTRLSSNVRIQFVAISEWVGPVSFTLVSSLRCSGRRLGVVKTIAVGDIFVIDGLTDTFLTCALCG